MPTKKTLRRSRIRFGIRAKLSGTALRPRLSVFRSNSDIYVQLIDDVNGLTLVSVNSSKLPSKSKLTKVEQSIEVGKEVAKLASAKGISQVVFDRGGYLYHGRVKALADGAREGGLQF